MDRLALTAFLRSLTRQKLYAALNIGGLALGIAVFLVLGLYVRFETSYERWLPDWNRLYVVEASDDTSVDKRPNGNTPVALWTAASRDLPGTAGTRLAPASATIVRDGIGVKERLVEVDPTFPKLFALPTVAGTLAGALDDPSSVVVTQRIADKYLGTGDPVGKPLTIAFNGATHNYRVAAVVRDLPANTDLHFDLIVRLVAPTDQANPYYRQTHEWNYYHTATYVRAADPADVARLTSGLNAVVVRHARAETPSNPTVAIKLSLRSIGDVHFKAAGEKLSVTTLGIVGVLTLLIAVVNYVNLASARAGLRAREVAMRKVLGASQSALLRHYLFEAVAMTALAALLGLALAEAGLPLVNAAGGLSLALPYAVVLPALALLVLVVGVVAGIYPAAVLARFPAAAVLASARSPGGGRAGTRIREMLVVFQFSIAIAFIVGTAVLVAQTRHIREADIGYDRQGLLVVSSLASDGLNEAQRADIVHRLQSLPNATGVTFANNVPGPGGPTMETTIAAPGAQGVGSNFRFFETAPGFFDVIGAHVLAGRVFEASRAADVNPNLTDKNDLSSLPMNIVINRTAARVLHFASPRDAIGKAVGGGGGSPVRTIIGVVEDMRLDSPRDPIPPTIYDFQLRDMNSPIAIVRFSGDPKAAIDAARAAWLQMAPEVPFAASTVVEKLDEFYAPDDHTARLFTIGALLAVLIGCVGLWGLASFNTARRVKEIGIRKTLGASTGDVVKLLVGQFLRPVLIANLFAWPLAWVAMRAWLNGFDDRIALSPLYFLGATVLALAIAVGTVIAQSLRAARATPAWALRHE